MKTKRIIILILLIVGSITFMGQISNAQRSIQEQQYRQLRTDLREGTFTPEQVKGQGMAMAVDRVEGAQNIPDLTTKAVVIVRGVVINAETNGKTHVGSLPLLSTTYTVEISEKIKGDVDTDTINVWQYGGNWKSLECTVTDDPNMVIGDEMILFLTCAGGVYRTYGGPDGKYVIKEGKVYHISETIPGSQYKNAELATNGIDYNSFIQQIK